MCGLYTSNLVVRSAALPSRNGNINFVPTWLFRGRVLRWGARDSFLNSLLGEEMWGDAELDRGQLGEKNRWVRGNDERTKAGIYVGCDGSGGHGAPPDPELGTSAKPTPVNSEENGNHQKTNALDAPPQPESGGWGWKRASRRRTEPRVCPRVTPSGEPGELGER